MRVEKPETNQRGGSANGGSARLAGAILEGWMSGRESRGARRPYPRAQRSLTERGRVYRNAARGLEVLGVRAEPSPRMPIGSPSPVRWVREHFGACLRRIPAAERNRAERPIGGRVGEVAARRRSGVKCSGRNPAESGRFAACTMPTSVCGWWTARADRAPGGGPDAQGGEARAPEHRPRSQGTGRAWRGTTV